MPHIFSFKISRTESWKTGSRSNRPVFGLRSNAGADRDRWTQLGSAHRRDCGQEYPPENCLYRCAGSGITAVPFKETSQAPRGYRCSVRGGHPHEREGFGDFRADWRCRFLSQRRSETTGLRMEHKLQSPEGGGLFQGITQDAKLFRPAMHR